MKIEIGNGKQLIIKAEEIFRDMSVGTTFIVSEDDKKCPNVWVKTPFVDMYEHNNPVNNNGAFCNAICINTGNEAILYMQCKPDAVCLVIDTHELFDQAEEY